MTLGEKIKKIRTDRKMTQVDLAIEIKVMPWMISKYENNKHKPSYDVLQRLIENLDLDPKELFGETIKIVDDPYSYKNQIELEQQSE